MNTQQQIEEGSTSSDSCRLEDIVNGIRFLVDSDDKLNALVDQFDNLPVEYSYDTDEGFIFDEICDRLNEIAPEDMIFGSQDGDGACFGFWKIEYEA